LFREKTVLRKSTEIARFIQVTKIMSAEFVFAFPLQKIKNVAKKVFFSLRVSKINILLFGINSAWINWG
jgi:hypothetical protein